MPSICALSWAANNTDLYSVVLCLLTRVVVAGYSEYSHEVLHVLTKHEGSSEYSLTCDTLGTHTYGVLGLRTRGTVSTPSHRLRSTAAQIETVSTH